MMLKKYTNNPVLKPNPDNYWESLTVCNPGVYYENDIFYMLYRAAGNDKEHVIRFGLATSNDGYNFTRVSDEPVIGPGAEGPDSGCIEDARIVKFDDFFYITYAFRPYPPGQYWTFDHDVVLTHPVGKHAPLFLKENMANSGLMITPDFKTWMRLGRITRSNLDDRDVILFPEKINNKYVMLHRPKEWVGPGYGTDYPAIWLCCSDDLLTWNEPSYLLITGIEGSWEEKIGGSTPPLRTEKGWLVLYHGVEKQGKGYYRVGALLLDLNDPFRVLGRTRHWIMEPEYDYETDGPYPGCVFPTGNVIIGDQLFVYYGAADKNIGLATANVNELVDYILKS
ncbi:MAG: glycosidase [Bacteroidales bacterium]